MPADLVEPVVEELR
jgi:hypothetical protein